MESLTLSVSGMSCQGCANSLTRLFTEQPGVAEVAVSFEAGTAAINYEPDQVAPPRLSEIVVEAGFEVA